MADKEDSSIEAGNTVDGMPLPDAANALHRAQRDAIETVGQATGQVVAAARLLKDALGRQGRIVYAGAGTSGLMAMADALELPLTYGVDPAQILILLAGGMPSGAAIHGSHDDDIQAAADNAKKIASEDAVIGVSASGSTPYTVALLGAAKDKGAATVAIANREYAPLFDRADVAICLPTAPELVAGSTRMGAGTAQKVCLNMVSTLLGIELGHVHEGRMVNFIVDNDKLRQRAVATVAALAGTDEKRARACLEDCGWQVKVAVLLAKDIPPAKAQELLGACRGNLRDALAGS